MLGSGFAPFNNRRSPVRYAPQKAGILPKPNLKLPPRPILLGSSRTDTKMTSNNRPPKPKPTPNTNQRQDPTSQWRRRYEHYRDLAQRSGDADSVTREHYWQHAEHFCRLINGSSAAQL